jgi:hypothetical protein
MKKPLMVLCLLLLTAGTLVAIPNVFSVDPDGWMQLGVGISISLPKGDFSVMFDFDVGAPQQFGLSISFMIGARWLATLGLFYLIDPAPGSFLAIPVELKGGILRLNFDNPEKTIIWGLGLSTGVRFYPVSVFASDCYFTGDVRAAVYWNFGEEFDFSIDAFPGLAFCLVATDYYPSWYW